MSTITKSGTGAGALLVVQATPATLAVPAAAPSAIAFTVAPATTPTGIAVLAMKSFTLPSQKYKFDSITNCNSPQIGQSVQEESQITTLDPGEASFTGVFQPSDPGLVALQTAFATGIPQGFQVQLQPIAGQSTKGNVYAFNGWVSENPQPGDISADKAPTVKVTIKLTTLMLVTVGS